jgi:hypothetical protein
MNTNPWQHTLRMLQPDIDVLQEFMNRGPQIKPKLKLVHRTWVLEISEDWGIFHDAGNSYVYDTPSLDQRVIWSAKQLETWDNVSRQAWNMWHFKRKKDAEKFITLYNLKWAE